MAKNIEKLRQLFYLDSDGECRWKYVELTEFNPSAIRLHHGYSDLNLGICHVCGKNPIIYNYILKYEGKELKNTNGSGYASVGSECIESLSNIDMLRIEKDTREARERHQVANGIAFGVYLRDVFNPEHQEVWKMTWEYFGNARNLGGSVKLLWEKCLSGVPLHEKTFGKEVRKALKEKGFEIPDMREIKKIINWTGRKEIRTSIDEDGPVQEGVTQFMMVPEGMEFRDYYGISPITGRREPLYTELVDSRTGTTIVPDSESYLDSWDPVIEVVESVDWDRDGERYEPTSVMHVHLKKWLARNRPSKPEPVKEIDPLIKALRAIAGDDNDRASARNDVGFSGFDTEFGHSLASRDFLTEKQLPHARRLVWKYRKQLQEHYPEIWKKIEEEVKQ